MIYLKETALLEALDLSAGYGPFVILNDVSLRIFKGEIVALVGPNGAGKTTTLRTIMGLTTLYKGKIVLNGSDITKTSPHKRIELGVAMVPEGRGIFDTMTVIENLYMGAYNKRAREKLEESLEIVFSIFPRLKERKNQLAGTLSGGEAQMLAIGRALMARPKILLLDEPSQGLAPKVVIELFEIFKRLNREWDITLLLVEQHVKNALELADRAYVMETGRIILEGESKMLISDERLRKAYLVI